MRVSIGQRHGRPNRSVVLDATGADSRFLRVCRVLAAGPRVPQPRGYPCQSTAGSASIGVPERVDRPRCPYAIARPG